MNEREFIERHWPNHIRKIAKEIKDGCDFAVKTQPNFPGDKSQVEEFKRAFDASTISARNDAIFLEKVADYIERGTFSNPEPLRFPPYPGDENANKS